MEQRPCTSGQSKGFCKMIFSSRFRIGMAALLSACLILTLCFFRGEMFFMRKSRVVDCSADKFLSQHWLPGPGLRCALLRGSLQKRMASRRWMD